MDDRTGRIIPEEYLTEEQKKQYRKLTEKEAEILVPMNRKQRREWAKKNRPNPKDSFYCCSSSNACCESCHEDDIDYGYDICTTDFDIPGKSVTVLHCCKAKPSQEDVEKRAKELYENE